jgi:hypothetical protein
MIKYIKEVNLDAVVKNDETELSLDINNNGDNRHYDFILDNNNFLQSDKMIQLENILNVPSVNIPIDKRLQNKLNLSQIAYLPDNKEDNTTPIIENMFIQIVKKTKKTKKRKNKRKTRKTRK